MDMYIISPLNHLELMLKGDRLFCLAHLYHTNEKYKQFFLHQKNRGAFITLDNGAAEKSLVTEDILIDIVKELMPNEVIAPDVLFNKSQTVNNLFSFMQRMKNEGLLDKVAIFGAPQGSTREEWVACYKVMLATPQVKTIGLSKISVPYCWGDKATSDTKIMESRVKCVHILQNSGLIQKPIHCLGMGNPLEYTFYKDIPLIRSTDSCYTVLAALKGVDFSGPFKRVETTNDYFTTALSDSQYQLAKKNIDYLKNLLKKGI